MASDVKTPVPPALLRDRQEGWNSFTRFTKISTISVVVVLLGMLVFLY
ncbi:MAG TPA: hypothetical protein VEH84_02510 [Alphaproteobacteria bacterium]|nr:hypothetical protein [Alphaproteobacteria bacterium]